MITIRMLFFDQQSYLINFFFSQIISLMKYLYLLVEKHMYQYLILASLILEHAIVVLVQYN